MSSSTFVRMVRSAVALILVLVGFGAAALTAAGPATAGLIPGVPDTLSVTAPATAAPGTPVTVNVEADAIAAADPTYTGTIHFTSSDPLAVLPADYTFSSSTDMGAHDFMVTFKTVGSQTVTATDKAATGGATAGTSDPVAVAVPTTKFTVSAPATASTGSATSVTVTALTSTGATATGYVGTVKITSTDTAATLPANYKFLATDMGVHVFTVTFKTAGSQTVTATDTTTATITGTSGAVVVSAPGAATKLKVTTPATAPSGTPVSVVVTALDASGNTASGYVGTVKLTSTDTMATLPADYTFVAADAGSHTLMVTFKTVGSQTVTATDTTTATIAGTSAPVTVAGPTTKLKVDAPATATAGTPSAITVTAQDAAGTTNTAYAGMVQITSTDSMATLPANYTFVAADKGVHVFMVTFKTAGSQTVTATDTATATITGTSAGVVVAGPATKFTVSAPATASVGTPVSVVVTAKDANNTTTTGYVGTVKFASTDTMATLPPNYTFTAADMGVHTFMVTFKTAGSQTVTVTDTTTATITGTSTPATTVTGGAGVATTTQVGSNPQYVEALVKATTGTPTGTVSFTVNGVSVGSSTLNANGLAAVAYALKTGQQNIVASYAGATGFAASTGMRTVNGPSVSTSLTSAFPKTTYGWYRSNVKVAYACTAGTAAVVACPGKVTLSAEGAKVTVTKTIVDKDGGRTVITTTVKIDKTKPTVTVSGVMKGHTYATDPKIRCTATDSLSGVVSCKVVKARSGKSVKYTATGTDKAGNVTRKTGTYKLR